uniref:Cadherin domain-containing protein n=1 Tax=Timema genevievae TaxID=629358 RepID=A0A7R9JRQ7_TIMGE|nr:unnamed protein product [Timema genevievae]
MLLLLPQLNQATSPAELPVVGDPFSEIVLELVFPKGLPLFILNGKKLQLLKPLDRDEENLSHIVFQPDTLTTWSYSASSCLSQDALCRTRGRERSPERTMSTLVYHTSGPWPARVQTCAPLSCPRSRNIRNIILEPGIASKRLTCTVVATNKKRTIPVIIRVSDINDNPPVFVKTPYHTSVSEWSYQTSVLEVSLTNLERQGYYQTSVLEVSPTNLERQWSYQTSVLERLYKELALSVGIKLDIRYPHVFHSGSGTAVPESSGRGNKLLLLPVYSMRLTPVGTTIFQGVQAKDPDAGVNGQVDYHVVPGDGVGLGLDGGVGRDRLNVADGAGFFSINLPHQGQVTVNRSLDYENDTEIPGDHRGLREYCHPFVNLPDTGQGA